MHGGRLALVGRHLVEPKRRLLRGLRGGFYAWQQRPPSTKEMANRRPSKDFRGSEMHRACSRP